MLSSALEKAARPAGLRKNPHGEARAAFIIFRAYNPGTKKHEYLLAERGPHYRKFDHEGQLMLFGGRVKASDETLLAGARREVVEEMGAGAQAIMDKYPDGDFKHVHKEFTPADLTHPVKVAEEWQDDDTHIFVLDLKSYEEFSALSESARLRPKKGNDEVGMVRIMNQDQIVAGIRDKSLNTSFPYEEKALKKAVIGNIPLFNVNQPGWRMVVSHRLGLG